MLAQRRIGLARPVEVLERARVALLDVGEACRRLLVLAVAVADPHVERRAPPALPRESPVDVVRQEVTESAFLDVLRQPVHGAVVLDRAILERRSPDVPGGPRVLDERVAVGAPAERVIVPVLLGVHEQPGVLQVVLDLFVAVLDPAAAVALEPLHERAIRFHCAEERHVRARGKRAPMRVEVVLAEGGGDVNDAGAGVERHEVGCDDAPDHVLEAARLGREEVERRAVCLADEVRPLELALDLELAELLRQPVEQPAGEDESLAVLGACDHVVEVRPHGGVHVRRERPRGRRPHEQREVLLPDEREGDVDARVVDGLVPLPDLPGAERRPSLSPPPDDLVSLIEQPLLEEPRQRPPDALDVRAVVGDVRLVQIHPEGDALGQLLPLARVPEDGVDALLDERLDPVGLDRGLAVDPELFLDLDLDREPVRVPARLAGDAVAPHRLVAGEQVLDDARQHMPVVGQAVGGGRSLVEDERPVRRGLGEGLLEDALPLPEAQDVALLTREVELGRDPREDRLRHGAAF